MFQSCGKFLKSFSQRPHRHNVVGITEHRDLIVVDNEIEVIEPMLAGEHDRFPACAFVQFSIARQDEHLLRSILALQPERATGRNPKAMPQRAVDGLVTWNDRVGNAAENPTRSADPVEFLVGVGVLDGGDPAVDD
mgnify:CR=1 FL=1